MLVPVSSQAYIFLYTVFGGMIVGFIYDLFRVSRKIVKTKNILVYFEDVIFWFIVSLVIFITLFICNAGEIRGYSLLGIILGVIIYVLMLSHFIVKFLIKVVEFLKKIILFLYRIIMIPIKMLFRIFYYPIMFLYRIIKKKVCFLVKIRNFLIQKIKFNLRNIKIRLKKI